eukprot:CAMPEP_0115007472 /NCGR_PEP_ID=MMETSP0216-20121206/21208_1 /TAXON_ID=223996 /ORGANISM="Protocruzia adherens, Strain Boccale" /LENGTH=65 /DNA_ID=CAMNT_0002374437 /DNA_START=1884 /DNA_END=2078 /DNA_ORIENTATION=+
MTRQWERGEKEKESQEKNFEKSQRLLGDSLGSFPVILTIFARIQKSQAKIHQEDYDDRCQPGTNN